MLKRLRSIARSGDEPATHNARRRRNRNLVIAGLAFAGGAVASVWMASSPMLCASCHHTRPYVHNWRTSGHRSVHCLQCHSPAESRDSIVRTALDSLRLSKRFATEQVAEDDLLDESLCMRDGCHSTRLLDGDIEDCAFLYEHDEHLEKECDTVELRCASCHPETAHSPPPGPARSTCALCHESQMRADAPVESCLECHPEPIGAREGAFDHQPLGAEGRDCALCHGDMLSGSRKVSEQRCSKCHPPQGRIDSFNLPSLVHYATVTERGIGCSECHDDLAHESAIQPVPQTIEEARKRR